MDLRPLENSSAPPCILCARKNALALGLVDAADIWAALEQRYAAVFTQDERLALAPTGAYSLWQCQACGLHYFDPPIPGDSIFYARLSAESEYYVADRWDFHAALRRLSSGDRVLDIACGGGRFLEMARQAQATAVGIDTNEVGVARARRLGLDVQLASLDQFASQEAGRFDVVTAFQVLEHVPDPTEFVRLALTCVKPGGLLLVSVPNRERCVKERVAPLDCPPHHLTRWASPQMLTLAHILGTECVSIELQEADMHECRRVVRDVLFARSPNSALARAVGFAAFNPLCFALFEKLNGHRTFGLWGMSLLASFKRN